MQGIMLENKRKSKDVLIIFKRKYLSGHKNKTFCYSVPSCLSL
jgi:hypothetical protein